MRAYSRVGDDGVKTTIDVGREVVAVQVRNSDVGLIVGHLSRGDAMELAENLIYALTHHTAPASIVPDESVVTM